MSNSLPLFCPNCSTLLVASHPPRSLSTCPSCGQAVGAEQRALQKTGLPFYLQFSMGIAGTEHQLCAWGTQNDQVELLQIDLLSSKIQSIFATPNNWQVNRLAITEKVIVFAPGEHDLPGSPKALIGIDLETGKTRWEHPTSGFMFTAPAADEQIACVVDSNGTLIAVDSSTGKSRWSAFPELGDHPYCGIPPVLSQSHVLAVESEGRGAGLVAFHRATGEVAWQFRPPEHVKVDFAPAVSNEFAFVLAGKWLYRVSLQDGTWTRLSCAERKSSQGWYFAPPVLDEERIYLLEAALVKGKPAYALQARDLSTGQLLWHLDLDYHPHQPPAISDEYVYFVDRKGKLFCLDKQDGRIVWQEYLGAEPADAPLTTAKAVFVLTKDAMLHTVKLFGPIADISHSPYFYENHGEWVLAAGAYLANFQAFEAGLALLKINEYKQADLAFRLCGEDAEQRIRALRQDFLDRKNDAKAGKLSQDWGMILMERLGRRAQCNALVAEWFEQAAESFMLANQTQDFINCREQAAQVMEIPRIKLEVVAEENVHWVVNEPVLLQVKVTNVGYGPARRIAVKMGGNIRRPHPSQSFTDLAVDQTQRWDNVRVVPNSSGAALLEFVLDYESYRTGKTTQTRFTHPIRVEKNQAAAITRALQKSPSLHIETFFSPGATNNKIEIIDSQGIAVGDHTQLQTDLARSAPEVFNDNKETEMDAITLIISALIGGLTAGLTDTAKTAAKDIYDAFKARLTEKTQASEDAQDALIKVEKQPDSKARQELLKEELGKLSLESDQELLKLAQSLLDTLKVLGKQAGKFNVNMQNSQGTVIGDNATVTQNFGDTQKKKQK